MFVNRQPVSWCLLSLSIVNVWLVLIVFLITQVITEYLAEILSLEDLPAATMFALKWGVSCMCLATILSMEGFLKSTGSLPSFSLLTVGFNVMVVVELILLTLLFLAMCLPMVVMTHRIGV